MKTILLALMTLFFTESVQSSENHSVVHTENVIKIANLDKLEIQTVIGKGGVNDLYDRFTMHYGEFVSGINTRKVDFDFVMGVQSGETSQLLFFLYTQAQQEGLPLVNFIDFGISPQTSDGYEFSHKKSAHLVELKYFIEPLTKEKFFNRNTQLLLQKGLSANDLSIIKRYLQQHPFSSTKQKLEQSLMGYIKDNSEFLTKTMDSKSTMPPTQYQHIFDKFFYVASYLEFHYYRNWTINLMSTLEPKQQEILKTVMLAVISGEKDDEPTAIFSRLETLEERISINRLESVFQSVLNQPSQKLN